MKRTELELKSATWDESGLLEGYASVKGSRDKVGDVVAEGAYLNLDRLTQEGYVTVNHEGKSLPVATVEAAAEDERGLRVGLRFHSTPAAQDVRTVVRERLERGKSVGLSIGYITRDAEREPGGRTLKAIEVREVALVANPAHDQAQALSLKHTEQNMQETQDTSTKRLNLGDVWEAKSLADALMISPAWQSRGPRGMTETELKIDPRGAIGLMEQKATMTTAAGYAPDIVRTDVAVASVQRPPQLIDYLPVVPTNQNAYKFMAETTFTNAAAAAAEGTALSESSLAFTEVTVPIQRIGAALPVTEEQLEDEPGVRALIEQRLTFMIRQALDTQVLTGDGVAPNLTGILELSGIQSQAKGSDVLIDAIAKAMGKVRSSGTGNGAATPNLVVLHPNDYLQLILARTTDGEYILGHPSDEMTRRLMGVTIAINEALPEGTGLVLDTRFFPLVVRQGVNVAISESHADTFTKNVVTVRAHVRAALASYRDAAACLVTGI